MSTARALSPSPNGSLSSFHSVELVEQWLRSGDSGQLRIECELGTALLWVSAGEVVDCCLGALKGDAAFHCVLGLRAGTYAFRSGEVHRPSGLSATTHTLLRDHRAHAQEWEHIVARLPLVGSVLAPDRQRLDQWRVELSAAERKVLGLVEQRRRLHELVEECDLPPLVSLQHLLAFLHLGLVTVERRDSSSPQARSSAPPAVARTPVPRIGSTVAPPTAPTSTAPSITSERASAPYAYPSEFPRAPSGVTEPASVDVGRYEVLSRLGRGELGTVYLVRLKGAAGFVRPFALKVLRAHLAFEQVAVGALLEEARVVARICHVNVVGIEDIGYHGRQPYVVMEYIPGTSFANLLATPSEHSSARCVVAVLLDAMAGVVALHAAADVDRARMAPLHHGLSPRNILIGLDGVSRVTDFKLGALYHQGKTPTQSPLLGSMSPEAIHGGGVDERSDVFSLGAIMWTALTGTPLFPASNPEELRERILHGTITAPSAVNPSPVCLDVICLRALERSPKNRFPSVSAMLSELRRVAIQNDLLASPREVAVWVRSVKGVAADYVFDLGADAGVTSGPLRALAAEPQVAEPTARRKSLPIALAKAGAVVAAVGALTLVITSGNVRLPGARVPEEHGASQHPIPVRSSGLGTAAPAAPEPNLPEAQQAAPVPVVQQPPTEVQPLKSELRRAGESPVAQAEPESTAVQHAAEPTIDESEPAARPSEAPVAPGSETQPSAEPPAVPTAAAVSDSVPNEELAPEVQSEPKITQVQPTPAQDTASAPMPASP